MSFEINTNIKYGTVSSLSPKVNILEIPIYAGNLSKAVSRVINICLHEGKETRCISATSVHGVVYSKKNRLFRDILKSFYGNLPDGKPLFWIGQLKGAAEIRQCTGPDFFKELIEMSAFTEIKHYFCGGKEGIAEKLKKVCKETYNNSNIVGTFSPPFREMTEDELVSLANEINSKNADIVWIGLSTPKQELFANRILKYINAHFIITVGAAFDFHSGNLRKAPKIVTMIGVEWFFRLVMEPKRLYKRYLEIVPMYIAYNGLEFILHVTNIKNWRIFK